jgi:hypothetical protein
VNRPQAEIVSGGDDWTFDPINVLTDMPLIVEDRSPFVPFADVRGL